MSLIDPADWYTGEYDQQVKPQQVPPPARPKARPASAKRSMPDATKRAIDDINNRYASALNDDISDL
jgi:hypothetical protein